MIMYEDDNWDSFDNNDLNSENNNHFSRRNDSHDFKGGYFGTSEIPPWKQEQDYNQGSQVDPIFSNRSNFAVNMFLFIFLIFYLVDLSTLMNRSGANFIFAVAFYGLFAVLGLLMDGQIVRNERLGIMLPHIKLKSLILFPVLSIIHIMLPFIFEKLFPTNFALQGISIILSPYVWLFILFMKETKPIHVMRFAFIIGFLTIGFFYALNLFLINTGTMAGDFYDTVDGSTLQGRQVFSSIGDLFTKPFRDLGDSVDKFKGDVTDSVQRELYYFRNGHYPTEEGEKELKPNIAIAFEGNRENYFADADLNVRFNVELENFDYKVPIRVSCAFTNDGVHYLEGDIKFLSGGVSRYEKIHSTDLTTSRGFTCFLNESLVAANFVNESVKVKVNVDYDFMSNAIYNAYAIDGQEYSLANYYGEKPLDYLGVSNQDLKSVYSPGPLEISLGTSYPFIPVYTSRSEDVSLPESYLGFSFKQLWDGNLKSFNKVFLRVPENLTMTNSCDTSVEMNYLSEEDIGTYCVQSCISGRNSPSDCRALCDSDNYDFQDISVENLNRELRFGNTEINGANCVLDVSNGDSVISGLKYARKPFALWVFYTYNLESEDSFRVVEVS